MESILLVIKQMLGLKDTTAFDVDILAGINSAIYSLQQIGYTNGLVVTDSSQVWGNLATVSADVGVLKSYVYLKTKLMFDPPGTSFVIDAYKNQIQEIEYRLFVASDPPMTEV